MSDTLPDAMTALKSKTKLCCAEIVEGGDLLWMGLEIAGETAKANRKGRKGRKGKRKGANDRAPYFRSVLIRAVADF
ncbi:MAG: hypothetical protein ABSG52_09500 [Terriglobales bacterium]